MKKLLFIGLSSFFLAMMIQSLVLAHGRYNFGFNLGYLGPGFYGDFGYGAFMSPFSPYFYPPLLAYPPFYPPTVIAPSAPPVYIQQNETAGTAQPQTLHYWYFCQNPEGYYPYIKQCPDGWLPVAPQPSD